MQNLRAVIFDLDGTLLNTLEDLTDAVNAALAHAGKPLRSIGEVRRFLGNGVQNLMMLAAETELQDPGFSALTEQFRSYYAAHCQEKTAPYAGIPEVLQQLKDKGIQLAIVSNKFDRAVKLLRDAYFSPYIAVAIGEQAGVRKKPAPDTVLAALEALGRTAEEAVYVGDSEVDLQTAKNAGMPCIAVTWGFRDASELQKLGAAYLADTPQQLLALLETFL